MSPAFWISGARFSTMTELVTRIYHLPRNGMSPSLSKVLLRLSCAEIPPRVQDPALRTTVAYPLSLLGLSPHQSPESPPKLLLIIIDITGQQCIPFKENNWVSLSKYITWVKSTPAGRIKKGIIWPWRPLKCTSGLGTSMLAHGRISVRIHQWSWEELLALRIQGQPLEIKNVRKRDPPPHSPATPDKALKLSIKSL